MKPPWKSFTPQFITFQYTNCDISPIRADMVSMDKKKESGILCFAVRGDSSMGSKLMLIKGAGGSRHNIILEVPKTWHLLLKAFCSRFLIKATQIHKLVSTRFCKSDDKKQRCLIPNDRDCLARLTSCLSLILRLSSMAKYQTNQRSSSVSPPFRSPHVQC